MARMIKSARPNGNDMIAEICNTDNGLVTIELMTAYGVHVVTTTVDKCKVRAEHPRNYFIGDVCIWVPELRIHVGTVIIVDGTVNVEVRTNGLEIWEE